MTLWIKASSLAISILAAGSALAQKAPPAPSSPPAKTVAQALSEQRDPRSPKEMLNLFRAKLEREGQTSLSDTELYKKINDWPEYRIWSSRNQSKDLPLTPPPFPKTLNGMSLSAEGLKGKVVLIMYSHTDDVPGAPFKFDQHLAKAQAFDGQPVVFINVVSGKPANKVQEFVQKNKLPWPTVVDEDSSYLKASGENEPVTCNNRLARVISPSGEFIFIRDFDWEKDFSCYVSQASWRVDPKEITPALKPAWQALEIGQFNQAASLLANAPRGGKDKAAADKIKSVISDELNRSLASATQAEIAGQHWQAYKQYQTLLQQFSNAAEAKDIKSRITKMATNPQVALELRADKLLTEAQLAARSPNAATQKKAAQMAQQVRRDFPGTEAAQKAIHELGSSAK